MTGRLCRLGALTLMALVLGGCLAGRPALQLDHAVVDGEATWSGEVRIRGIVTVKKSGTLTILPGTRIVFEPVDEDGDGIGDGELLVEGTLVARGTADQPIVFTSGAARPQRADWKFLYLDFARGAVVDHIVSEYAYSGIQVHFCRAQVTNSVFRHNVDGVRFSTVNIEVAGNRIHDNVHGLRYEERRSSAHIHHNDIRDNDIGVFAVTRSEDKARIEHNNITGSRRYSVKLGLEQPGDITLPRNWWGSADPRAIEAGFFDRRFDPALGLVRAPDPLEGPVEIDNWNQAQGE